MSVGKSGFLGAGVALFAAMAVGEVRMVRPEPVALWRGETTALVLNDHVRVGTAPAGLSVKTGVAEEIRYQTGWRGTHYATMADRVVWGAAGAGLRVAEVSADASVKPGVYWAGDLEITVLDRTLPPPKDWKYSLDLWQHPWAVSRYFGTEPFSPAHYRAMEPVWKLLATAGQKTLTVSILERPWNGQCYDAYHSMVRRVKRADGSWRFGYRILDEYVAFGRACGLGPDIACYTMCPWDYVVSWEDETGKTHAEKLLPGTPEFAAYWSPFLRDFAAHMKAKGWLSDTYIALDERKPEDVREIVRFIRENAPGVKLAFAGCLPMPMVRELGIENFCMALGSVSGEYLAEAAARRARGLRSTFYVCCGPLHPNTMCLNELPEAFWLGVFPAMCGLDGFLRWAWNSWPVDPLHDASYSGPGGWPSGDTYLAYPDGLPTLRFLELRNGIVAAEKIRILRERGVATKELDALAKKFDPKAATDNKAPFRDLRAATQKLVNGASK